jgi:hypothetical protein
MAARKPLVMNAGRVQQLQAGDTLDAPVSTPATLTLTNGDAGSHVISDVIYIDAADDAKKAKANAAGTADAFALATATITNGTAGVYQTNGLLAGLTGLTAGAKYFLSTATAGVMTASAPTAAGSVVVELGTAVSTTEFQIEIRSAVLL